jgi:hypothetical protein
MEGFDPMENKEQTKETSEVKANLQRFFEEKQLENRMYTIFYEGVAHEIDTAFVIDYMLNHLDQTRQMDAQRILTKMDVYNGNIHDFLQYVGRGCVKMICELTMRIFCKACSYTWDSPDFEPEKVYIKCESPTLCDNHELFVEGKTDALQRFEILPFIR